MEREREREALAIKTYFWNHKSLSPSSILDMLSTVGYGIAGNERQYKDVCEDKFDYPRHNP